MITTHPRMKIDLFAPPELPKGEAPRFIAHADGRFEGPAGAARCQLGKGGVLPAADKREGDGASPAGDWPLLFVLYRPDRRGAPVTALPVVPLRAGDGWCDAPDHPLYNQPVRRPFRASHEALWRDDRLYDVIVVLGHNLSPVSPGAGSAIFWHLTHPEGRPTQGCIALDPADMDAQLAHARPGDALRIA